jgi:phosphoribosylanthranilate isomerase
MTSFWNTAESGRTRIKICGLKDEAMIRVAIEAGADAIGFVLAEHSPRHIDCSEAIQFAEMLPEHVTAIGVVVDAKPELLRRWAPRWIQLHGQETVTTAEHYGGPVVRGLAFDTTSISIWDTCDAADRLLVDAPMPGSGENFDHTALSTITPHPTTPMIIAGGLDAASVGDVVRNIRPWGVDVSSGVECMRGVKDAQRIRDFCQAVRDADDS